MTSTMPAGEIAGRAAHLYRNLNSPTALLQRWRPYICPFGPILDTIGSGANVLDIGCGGGLFLGLLADAGQLEQGIGVDTSSAGIALAKQMQVQNGFKTGLNFNHIEAGEALPAGQFDTVTLIDVLHHIPAAAQNDTIAQAIQRVRPGGRFIVKDIATRPRWRAAANQLHDLLLARQWVRHMNEQEIMSAIDTRNIGGSWSNTLRINTLWYGHHLMVFERTLED